MEILKKTDRGDRKKNFYADTRPDLPTIDLDKLADRSRHLRNTVANSTIDREETMKSLKKHREEEINTFVKVYPPYFTRVLHPGSVIIDGETIKWDREWLEKKHNSPDWYCFKWKVEDGIIEWYLKGESLPIDKTRSDIVEQALKEIKDGYKI